MMQQSHTATILLATMAAGSVWVAIAMMEDMLICATLGPHTTHTATSSVCSAQGHRAAMHQSQHHTTTAHQTFHYLYYGTLTFGGGIIIMH